MKNCIQLRDAWRYRGLCVTSHALAHVQHEEGEGGGGGGGEGVRLMMMGESARKTHCARVCARKKENTGVELRACAYM